MFLLNNYFVTFRYKHYETLTGISRFCLWLMKNIEWKKLSIERCSKIYVPEFSIFVFAVLDQIDTLAFKIGKIEIIVWYHLQISSCLISYLILYLNSITCPDKSNDITPWLTRLTIIPFDKNTNWFSSSIIMLP